MPASPNWTLNTISLIPSVPPKGQPADHTGAVTFAQTYDPYDTVNTTSGASPSSYGFTNEYQSQGLIYLRSRMYSPANGRFLSRDTWSGDANRPLSFNRWGYVEGNPLSFIDLLVKHPMELYDGCRDTQDVVCRSLARGIRYYALGIKEQVRIGAILPVEGFALIADKAENLVRYSDLRAVI